MRISLNWLRRNWLDVTLAPEELAQKETSSNAYLFELAAGTGGC
jgi:hypothetical protein